MLDESDALDEFAEADPVPVDPHGAVLGLRVGEAVPTVGATEPGKPGGRPGLDSAEEGLERQVQAFGRVPKHLRVDRSVLGQGPDHVDDLA